MDSVYTTHLKGAVLSAGQEGSGVISGAALDASSWTGMPDPFLLTLERPIVSILSLGHDHFIPVYLARLARRACP